MNLLSLQLLLLPSLIRIAYTHTTSAKGGIILPQFCYIRLHTLLRSKQFCMNLLSLLLPSLIRIAYTHTTSAKRGIILPQFYYIRLHTLFSSKLYCMLLLSVLLRLLLLPSLFRIAYTHTTSAKRGIIVPQCWYIRLHTLRRSKQYCMLLLSVLLRLLPLIFRIAYTHTTSA